MPRSPKCRIISREPDISFFKPKGIPLRNLVEITLTCDGLEALKLVDVLGLDQETAASQMGVSRQTFGRILSEARRTVATAIVSGYALRITGGHYHVGGMGNE
ncbi:MAG: DUF134 domain-containing protein [Deltaproteobacteria bacterium]